MKRLLPLLVCAAALGCGQDLARRGPSLSPEVKKIGVRQVVNKSQQFGLEDKLTLALRDQFLRDATRAIVPEEESDAVVTVTIQRYILTPIQYDAGLSPTAYKLRVVVDLALLDRAAGRPLLEEKGMESFQTYAAAALPGGLSEERAQASLWDSLSRDIVARVLRGG